MLIIHNIYKIKITFVINYLVYDYIHTPVAFHKIHTHHTSSPYLLNNFGITFVRDHTLVFIYILTIYKMFREFTSNSLRHFLQNKILKINKIRLVPHVAPLFNNFIISVRVAIFYEQLDNVVRVTLVQIL